MGPTSTSSGLGHLLSDNDIVSFYNSYILQLTIYICYMLLYVINHLIFAAGEHRQNFR